MKTSWKNLRVAVFYDWLNQWGGAERVLLDILSLFPQAEIFTLFHDQRHTPWLPANFTVHTSFIKSSSPLLSPFYDLAAESFDFSNFDLIISTTTNVGHCLVTPPQSLFVCYYHNLNRHLYRRHPTWLSPLLRLYQTFDYIYARRPDVAFCNSHAVKNRLSAKLDITAKVIHPGIDTQFFTPGFSPPQNYFLIVSRLVPHKKIDYAIETFKSLAFPLKIVGLGRDFFRLRHLASSHRHIQFLGQVSPEKLRSLYQNCRALISPQLEDFGLASLEAQACGRPVIGFGQGGNLETVIHGQTGILYPHQTAASLKSALKTFLRSRISVKDCRQHSEKFSRQLFVLNFKKELFSLCRTKKII